MKISRFDFQKKDFKIEEDLDFSNEKFDPTHIRSIKNTHVIVTGVDYDDYLILNIKIKSDVIGVCSYSLEDVDYKVNISTSLTFTYNDDEEDTIHIDGPIFELDPYILDLIVADVPLTLVKKGAKLPSSGEGYRVLTEDEYNEEQANKTDPRWAALDDIDIDD
jgi:uncharacterized protein